MTRLQQTVYRRSIYLFVLLLLGLGFWLRLLRMLGGIFGYDEFFSLLAAQMVAQHGLPILPSGLFYDHGLLLSFISGIFIALLGYSELIARWPVLLISVFTIAAYYLAAKRLFDSVTTGVFAATLVAFDFLSIEWGTQTRMYTPAHLFVLLSIVWLLEHTLKQPSQRGRYVFLLLVIAALFSHTVTFLILGPLTILLLIFTFSYRSDWLRHPRLWQEGVVAIGVFSLVLALAAMGQTGSTNSLQGRDADAPPPLGLDFLQGFFVPGLEWIRFDDLIGFFQDQAYGWLFLLIIIALLPTLYRLLRRQATIHDIIFLFLVLYWALVILEMGGLLSHEWRKKTRYMFMLTLPAFFLLSAESLKRLLGWLATLISKLNWRPARTVGLGSMVSLLGIALIIFRQGPLAWETAQAKGVGGYHTAFTLVRQNWQAGDKVMTIQPAAAYLYTGQSDYYTNQETAKVLEDESDENTLIDRYIGSPLIDSVEEFNSALSDSRRVWYVIDQGRLFNRFDFFFTQQVFAQMDLVRELGLIYVFRSRPYPVPLLNEPANALDGNFNNLVRLEGYSLGPTGITPDGVISVALYWRPLIESPSALLKVFVHLRDDQGQVIAQADHFIYEGLLPPGEWYELQQAGEWLRDTADLQMPVSMPLDGGAYHLYIGLYDPITSERVPLLNDTSGENAIVIDVSINEIGSPNQP